MRLLHVVLSADLLSESVSAGETLPGPQDSVLWCGTVPFLCYDWSWQHRVPPCRILLQGNSRVFYMTELFLKIGSVNRVCREWLQQITNVFTTKCELNLKPCFWWSFTQVVMSAALWCWAKAIRSEIMHFHTAAASIVLLWALIQPVTFMRSFSSHRRKTPSWTTTYPASSPCRSTWGRVTARCS